jgi:hypothetical protein
MDEGIIKGIAVILSVLLFLCIWLTCAYFFVRGLYFLFVAVGAKNENYEKQKREGSLPASITMNPLNVLIHTEFLSQDGKESRQKGFRCILAFTLIVIGSLLIGNLIEMI